jgi:hypothetical protein
MSSEALVRGGERYSLAERQAREQRFNTWVFLLPARPRPVAARTASAENLQTAPP